MSQYARSGMPVSMYGDGGVLTGNANGRLLSPRFDPNEYSVFRIVPAPHMDHPGQLEPFRFDSKTFGQWYMPLWVIKSIGMDKTTAETWVVHNQLSTTPFNPNTNPVMMIRRAINKAVKDRNELQGWASLVQGGRGQGAPIPSASIRALVRVMLLIHNKKIQHPWIGSPAHQDGLAYFLLPQSGWEAVEEVCNVRQEGVSLTPDNPNAGYAIGDPISPTDGAFFVMYMKGHDPRQQMQTVQNSPYNLPQQEDDSSFKGYACHYEKFWNVNGQSVSAQIPPDMMANLNAKMKPWPEVVRVYTPEEQVQKLCTMFRRYSGLLVTALDDMYGSSLDAVVRQEGLAQLGRGPTVQANTQYPPQVPGVQMGYQTQAQPQTQPTAYGLAAQANGYNAAYGQPAAQAPAPTPAATAYPSQPSAAQPAPIAYPQPASQPAPAAYPYPPTEAPAAPVNGITPPFAGDPFLAQQVQAASAAMGHPAAQPAPQPSAHAMAYAPPAPNPSGFQPGQVQPQAHDALAAALAAVQAQRAQMAGPAPTA